MNSYDLSALGGSNSFDVPNELPMAIPRYPDQPSESNYIVGVTQTGSGVKLSKDSDVRAKRLKELKKKKESGKQLSKRETEELRKLESQRRVRIDAKERRFERDEAEYQEKLRKRAEEKRIQEQKAFLTDRLKRKKGVVPPVA